MLLKFLAIWNKKFIDNFQISVNEDIPVNEANLMNQMSSDHSLQELVD